MAVLTTADTSASVSWRSSGAVTARASCTATSASHAHAARSRTLRPNARAASDTGAASNGWLSHGSAESQDASETAVAESVSSAPPAKSAARLSVALTHSAVVLPAIVMGIDSTFDARFVTPTKNA